MSMFLLLRKGIHTAQQTNDQNQQHNTSKLQSTNTRMPTNAPHALHRSRRAIANTNRLSATLSALLAATRRQNSKAQDDLRRSDQDTEDDQHDDDPSDASHLDVGNLVREDLGEVEEDAAALVQDLDARFDLEVFAHTLVEGCRVGSESQKNLGVSSMLLAIKVSG